MTDPNTTPSSERSAAGVTPAAAAPVRVGNAIWPWLPLLACAAAAALPLGLYLVHLADPALCVRVAAGLTHWLLVGGLVAAGLLVLGMLLYPPLPAWIRLHTDRLRTQWTSDASALQRAKAELQHFENSQRHIEIARLAWIRRDFVLMAKHAPRAVELDPNVAQARYLLGRHLLENGEPLEAAQQFAAAERLDAGHAFGNALLLQARATHLSGKLDSALALFQAHIERHGASHRSHYFHGEALLAAARTEEAQRAFAAAAAAPKNRLPAEDNYYRALARVRSARIGKPPQSQQEPSP